MVPLAFKRSEPLTIGVELELQLIDLSDFDLAVAASDLIGHMERNRYRSVVTPELTESMIEVTCGVFTNWKDLYMELDRVRKDLVKAADWLNIGISGGGTHPFQRWQERRIFESRRFQEVSSLYGYLAKQFTVYGQHIHIGCENGDVAMNLLHALNRYVPHFIAMAASSPFYQGVDTCFHSARLNSISAFPLSGRAPYYLCWEGFCNDYFAPMKETGVISSIKDFYWDIRPKPEFGTIELRVCDTPLTVERAAYLAAYLQLLCAWLLHSEQNARESEYMVYTYNRFQACRFGLEGNYIDPQNRRNCSLLESVQSTLRKIETDSNQLPVDGVMQTIAMIRSTLGSGTDSDLLQKNLKEHRSMEGLVQYSIDVFRNPKHGCTLLKPS